ncbi:MAG: hypothetical protein H6963_06870 [Chromatiaceae bacterium]|nr:hypothetical protein [Chromatiaceae bacterium]MCP5408999.1 hypothetical protein [Chromatiaceae bacterium]MCP5441890.1 hypothetical protein [Chromatiaceae bacterium]
MKLVVAKSDHHSYGESRYAVQCTLSTVHGCVVTARNRITIPRRYASPGTPENAPCTTSD